jgi:hypothetical protein
MGELHELGYDGLMRNGKVLVKAVRRDVFRNACVQFEKKYRDIVDLAECMANRCVESSPSAWETEDGQKLDAFYDSRRWVVSSRTETGENASDIVELVPAYALWNVVDVGELILFRLDRAKVLFLEKETEGCKPVFEVLEHGCVAWIVVSVLKFSPVVKEAVLLDLDYGVWLLVNEPDAGSRDGTGRNKKLLLLRGTCLSEALNGVR